MNSRKSIREVLLAAAAVIITFVYLLVSMYLTRENPQRAMIWGLAAIFALLLAGIIGVGYYLCRRRMERITEQICDSIDQLIDGKRIEGSKDRETLTSKITMKLDKLSDVTASAVAQSLSQKQEVQQMVSDISHQLKTPIANIRMYSDTIANNELPKQQEQKFLEVLNGQVKKLEFLVNALIKMSRLESRLIRLQKSDTQVPALLEEVTDSVIPRADGKNISIQVNCPENLVLSCDPKWTAEALFNILENAVKYTGENGQILIRAEQLEMYSKIEITDNGIGISPERVNDIFKRFYRDSQVKRIEGLGIGLYLSRHIISQQGGYIRVHSRPGLGSTFSVFLPN
ncbi:sensor histidine kinase [Diplocloster modestus]|uniref:histidine kinase n=1 Tax=Diplocloster modestus TaxID=2850322 RepID=A0ABS6KA31_9FIRM|nr:HAMP domain-containing sensor histidine kinase [Diplocloster modestus]MBU9727385.1 HAMP domain-containing histidine kinase [Diplocloster modestus]